MRSGQHVRVHVSTCHARNRENVQGRVSCCTCINHFTIISAGRTGFDSDFILSIVISVLFREQSSSSHMCATRNVSTGSGLARWRAVGPLAKPTLVLKRASPVARAQRASSPSRPVGSWLGRYCWVSHDCRRHILIIYTNSINRFVLLL